MVANAPLPEISLAFTIDDIHKIREWNYERRKGMTREEKLSDIKRGAREFETMLIASRKISSLPIPS